MDFKYGLISFALFVYLQVVCYDISIRKAIEGYWFLALFYFTTCLFVQGVIIICNQLGIGFYEIPLLVIAAFLILNRGIRKVPSFKKLTYELPHFYLFSALIVIFIWYSHLSGFSILMLRENTLEAMFWSLWSALLLPVFAGLKERLELMDIPENFPVQGLLLIAVSFLILSFSFF